MKDDKKLPGEVLAIVLFWLGWVFVAVPVLENSIDLGERLFDQLMREHNPRFLLYLLLSPLNFLMKSSSMLVTAVLMFACSAFLKLMVLLVKSTEQTQTNISKLPGKAVKGQE